MNIADSEVVASIMGMAGYEICQHLEDADAVFLNTCSVRDNAEQKILSRLEFLHSQQKKDHRFIIGVLGCMAQRVADKLVEEHHVDLVAGPDAYLSLPELVAQVETGHKAVNVELSTTETYRDIVPQRICGVAHPIGGFVSIMRGCNNFCHYCIVPYTRGRERSRDLESILQEVKDLESRGFREVTLLGQNVNSYKMPNSSSDEEQNGFPQLLRTVARAVPNMRIRFTTSHPKDMSDETLHVIAEEPNICHHIHLPVQSGSDRILKLMNGRQPEQSYVPASPVAYVSETGTVVTQVEKRKPEDVEQEFTEILSTEEPVPSKPDNLSLIQNEKDMIIRALDKYKGHRKEAAKELGISERTLYRKIKEYQIES